MIRENTVIAPMLVVLFTLLSIAPAHSSPLVRGGSDGGGGYQYPQSKMLLKVVSEPLAQQIELMHNKAFAAFPENLSKDELARIIRTVVPMPDEYRERPNADGEMEGLMFDYDRNYCDASGCGPRILALMPFFDAYKGLPVRQLEREREKPEIYLLIHKDLRERLLHEVAHLLGIGTTPERDHHGDEFSSRLQAAQASQYVACESKDWHEAPYVGPMIYEGYLIHLQTGKKGYTWSYSTSDALPGADDEAGKVYVRDVIRVAAANAFSEKTGFDLYPHPQNAVVESEAGAYSLVDGILKWESKPSEIMLNMTESLTVDLQTGEAIRRVPDVRKYMEDKTVEYIETKETCRVESPVISLEF